jgi:hypothetical protein
MRRATAWNTPAQKAAPAPASTITCTVGSALARATQSAERFVENDIEIDLLNELTDQDFDRLGVSLGHRRRMLRAIRELRTSMLV